MAEVNRRNALQMATGLGLASLVGAGVLQAAEGEPAKPKADMTDRDRVLACGFTATEADCWELLAQAAGKFFELPKLHPMDTQEVATAIHVVQNKLLSRPTYRRYLEMAKAQKKD